MSELITIIDDEGNEITGVRKYSTIDIGNLSYYVVWDSEASFDAWQGTICSCGETPATGTVNASCKTPGGTNNNTLNCVTFNKHPDNDTGYCGFYSNFPDALNPKINTITGVTEIVELDSTDLEDQGYFPEEEG